MSFAFQRRESSPRSPEYDARSSSPSRFSPLWKNRGSKHGFDLRKIAQLVAAFVAFVVVLSWIAGSFSDDRPQKDPFVVLERGPNTNYFQDFEGGLDCRLSSRELYVPPNVENPSERKKYPYCPTRGSLLSALSGGGRHGFEQPYTPLGCHFKWYTPAEICMIIDRFDGMVFIGDELVGSIYAAFNMLLRSNIKLGALEQWRMVDKEIESCSCDQQFSNPVCSKYWITSSEEVAKHDFEGGPRSPYACNRIPHFYFPISGLAPSDLTVRFRELLDADPHSWKPVPIIHSLGLSTKFNWQTATESMDEWLTIADGSGRNTPFLWLGPNSAGHLKAPNRIMQEGNNALWHYSLNMGSEAKRRGVEHINFYNMTVQATSYDGSSYGQRVSLTQAMMVSGRNVPRRAVYNLC